MAVEDRHEPPHAYRPSMSRAMLEILRGADPYVALASLTSVTAWWLAEMLHHVKPEHPDEAVDRYLQALNRNARIVLPYWQTLKRKDRHGAQEGGHA